ncbi:succinate dehydrogenase cytochrome b556 small membrane subunit [mine drainage metagenome]|uniref:Succinate dehydrogenase cytochrome b556 small membrane subunit n=1 Tax=mine drainage metagenome TaxID=410659 RepID=A0A1J5SQB3_9ZZZZ
MSLRTVLGRVRGLGSAKSGTREGAMQRLTAMALVPLCLWLIASIVSHVGASYETMHAWLGSTHTSALLLCLLFALVLHVQLGLKMVVDDYVHGGCAHAVTLLAIKLGTVLVGVFTAVAVLRAAFVGV